MIITSHSILQRELLVEIAEGNVKACWEKPHHSSDLGAAYDDLFRVLAIIDEDRVFLYRLG